MLVDENKPVRDIAVDKIMSLRETLTAGDIDTFEETSCEKVKAVRKFKVPFINENATSYHQLVDLRLKAEPPLLHHLTNDELKSVRQKPTICSSSSPATTKLLNATLSWSLKHPLLRQVLKEEMA